MTRKIFDMGKNLPRADVEIQVIAPPVSSEHVEFVRFMERFQIALCTSTMIPSGEVYMRNHYGKTVGKIVDVGQ